MLIRHEKEKQAYPLIFEAMRTFTKMRDANTPDEIWLMEHHPVFTQGLAGKAEHILSQCEIPIIQTDRGGQVTYHGPGLLMVYPLLNLKRLNLGIKSLIHHLEHSVMSLLNLYGIASHTQPGAPGVYVDNAKILSLGLRITRGYTYHGLCLNVDGDLSPFQHINPCGFQSLKMTRIADFCPDINIQRVIQDFIPILLNTFSSGVSHEQSA